LSPAPRCCASLDDDAYELQVDTWIRELHSAGAAEADLLYLHHLTPERTVVTEAVDEFSKVSG
jgi:hypothetical protein